MKRKWEETLNVGTNSFEKSFWLRLHSTPGGTPLRVLPLLLAAVVGSAGCASTGPNVRAIRAFERENVTPELLFEHVDQLSDTLELIRKITRETPYRPGDAWVLKLPLNAESAALAAQLQATHATVESSRSVLTLYRAHVSDVLARAKDARDSVAQVPRVLGSGGETALAGVPPSPANYGSIFAALSKVDPSFAALQRGVDAERQMREQVAEAESRLAELTKHSPTQAQIEEASAEVERQKKNLVDQQAASSAPVDPSEARKILQDAVSATSVALRLAMEASSLATVAATEAVTLTSRAPGELIRQAPNAIGFVNSVAEKAQRLAKELDASVASLRSLVDALARLAHLDRTQLEAFAFRDGLVDEIVGFGLDSVHFTAEGGGEAYFYNAIEDTEQSSNSKASYDYTGRTYKLVYHVDPIVLAAARLSAKIDFARLPDFAGLKLAYATNRVYRSGGEIQSGSLANEIGVSSNWSDALDAALSVAGVEAKVRYARFTSGTVDLVQVADGSVLMTAPFTFSLKNIDLSYDFAPPRGPLLQSLALSVGYFDYTLPRILYELENITPNAEQATYVYARETPPQAVRTRLGIVGLTAKVGRPLAPNTSVFCAVNLSIGFGPTSYYFLKDANAPDEEANRDYTNHTSMGAGAKGVLGFRWRFVTTDSRFSAHLEASYQAQLLASELNADSDKTKSIKSGSTDLFHGPTASLGASF